jgi:GT2 family glycosyltransferase
VERRWLERAIASVQAQIYPHWELCIADDGSTRAGLRAVMERQAQQDDRIRVRFLANNGGIARASNAALALARGEFVALLDHDDELAPDALAEVACWLDRHPDADMIYSDEDKLDPRGRHCDPCFKPDWSPDLLLSCMYTCHLGVYRRALMERLGGFREGFDGAQDYDLVLRLSEHTQRIHHIPKILYHWRMLPGSLSLSTQGKRGALACAQHALDDALQRRGLAAAVEPGLWRGSFRVRYDPSPPPDLSVVIFTTDPTPGHLAECLGVVQAADERRRWELLVVSDTLSHGQLMGCLPTMRRVLPKLVGSERPGEGAGVTLNRAVSYANGECLLFLGDHCLPASPASIAALLEHGRRREIGAVGGRVLTSAGTTVDCGLVLNLGGRGLAGPHSVGLPSVDYGYFGRNGVIHNLSALSLRALMLRRHVLLDVGGFGAGIDFHQLGPELCLRLHLLGLRMLYTPFATFVRKDSVGTTRPEHGPVTKAETALRNRWAALLQAGDPFYNPNLNLQRGDFTLRGIDTATAAVATGSEAQAPTDTRASRHAARRRHSQL